MKKVRENLKIILGMEKVLLRNTSNSEAIKEEIRVSLVVQWLRVCLPMQGTRV